MLPCSPFFLKYPFEAVSSLLFQKALICHLMSSSTCVPGTVSKLKQPSFPSIPSTSEGLESFSPFWGNWGSERANIAPGRRSWSPCGLYLLCFMSLLSWRVHSEQWFPNFGRMSISREAVIVCWQSCRSRHPRVERWHLCMVCQGLWVIRAGLVTLWEPVT